METEKRNILLVDDEEALVWSLSQRITKLRPDYLVETAGDGHTALERIGARAIDLLVTDIRMPGMSGLDLIMTARRVQTSLPVIVMTAYSTPDVHQEIRLRGSIDYLEKPFEFDRFLTIVDEALGRRQGFSGAILVQTLPDVVQLYALSGVTGILSVRHRREEGAVWFERGAVTHATTRAASGDEAFHEIMIWSGGDFSMRLGVVAPSRSIRANWTELIMESCRRIDESRRHGAEAPVSKAGWSLAPPEDTGSNGPTPPPPEHVIVDMIFGDADGVLSREKTQMTNNIKESLSKLGHVDGIIGAALVDSESGMLLGQEGGNGFNLEVAGAANTEVVKSKRKAMRNLNLKDEIEDILITLNKQYHIIRPLRKKGNLFLYLALDRGRANLAMARLALADVERDLEV